MSFFPDKSLTLTAESNNTISGLKLETSGSQFSYFRADRIFFNEMRLANGLIENLATPKLGHQAANKFYVDNRLIAYTPTDLLDFRFESIYANKSEVQTTDLHPHAHTPPEHVANNRP